MHLGIIALRECQTHCRRRGTSAHILRYWDAHAIPQLFEHALIHRVLPTCWGYNGLGAGLRMMRVTAALNAAPVRVPRASPDMRRFDVALG